MGNGRQQVASEVMGRLMPALQNPFYGFLPKRLWSKVKDFFAYSVEFDTLAANGDERQRTQIQADSDFILLQIMRTVRPSGGGNAVTDPQIRIQLETSGSGRNLMDSLQPLENISGTAQDPYFLPYPKVLKRNSTLTTRLVEDSGNARIVRVTYAGFKIFPNQDQ